MKKHICQNCGIIYVDNYKNSKYCSIKCQQEYQSKLKYRDYLNNQDNYKDAEMNPRWIKKHILLEQGGVCSICGIEQIWNEKELHFILDHIDGNARNNIRTNLRLICPNCDSQLDTYKSRNIGRCTRQYTPHKEAINKGE